MYLIRVFDQFWVIFAWKRNSGGILKKYRNLRLKIFRGELFWHKMRDRLRLHQDWEWLFFGFWNWQVISRLEASSSGDTGGWFKWDFEFLVLNNCQVLFFWNHKHLILRRFKPLWFIFVPFCELYWIHTQIDCEIRVHALLICLTDFLSIMWLLWSLKKS